MHGRNLAQLFGLAIENFPLGEKKVEDIVEKREAEMKQKRQAQEQTGDSKTNKRK